MSSLLRQIDTSFEPLYGVPCWNARVGHGSFLTFEFGQPYLEIREPTPPNPEHQPSVQRLLSRRQVHVHGEWHLWVYCCDWFVSFEGERVNGNSSRRRMERAARALNGQALLNVSSDLRRSRWFFDFDLGGRLETRPFSARSGHYQPENVQWKLYQPSAFVLSVRADGTYSHQPGATTPAEVTWMGVDGG
jgi:hypothetical protein